MKFSDYFVNWRLNEEAREYIRFHCRRYELLLSEVCRIVNQFTKTSGLKILDIGPAFQTKVFRRVFPDIIVDSLGFRFPEMILRTFDRHFDYDLNNLQYQDNCPDIGEYDIVVFAETIEHLYAAPTLVLKCINKWTKPGGYLIIQTPNAVSLRKRFKMLLGKFPLEVPREDITNPGHFREYTLTEIISFVRRAGFQIENYIVSNFYNYRKSWLLWLYNMFTSLLPQNFRDGIMVCCRKNSDEQKF